MGLGSGGFEFLCFTNRYMLLFLFFLFFTFSVGKGGTMSLCVWNGMIYSELKSNLNAQI